MSALDELDAFLQVSPSCIEPWEVRTYLDAIRDENANLRELCADLYKLADESYVPFVSVNKWVDEIADIERRMRELGIEVPDA